MITYKLLFVTILIFYTIKASDKGAFYLLLAYLAYYVLLYIDIPASQYMHYYSLSAMLSLLCGMALQRCNIKAALCSYIMVFVNIFGAALWYNYREPCLYDTISALVLALQMILITPKGVINGLRIYWQHITAKLASFDDVQSRVTMHKNQTKKKSNQ